MASKSDINDKNIKACQLFENIVCESIKHENIVDLNELDEQYLKLKKIIENKNKIIGEWYDETYHSNVFDMNINMNVFGKLVNKNSNNILTITY